MNVCVLSRVQLFSSPHRVQPARLLCPQGKSKNTGVGSLALLQPIFPIQE